MTRLQQIKKRLDEATPWDSFSAEECSYLGETLICLSDTYENCECDTELIANAPTDLRDLLAAYGVLVAEVSRLEMQAQEVFHLDTCHKSMGCHCREIDNEALTKANKILEGE